MGKHGKQRTVAYHSTQEALRLRLRLCLRLRLRLRWWRVRRGVSHGWRTAPGQGARGKGLGVWVPRKRAPKLRGVYSLRKKKDVFKKGGKDGSEKGEKERTNEEDVVKFLHMSDLWVWGNDWCGLRLSPQGAWDLEKERQYTGNETGQKVRGKASHEHRVSDLRSSDWLQQVAIILES